MSISGSSGGRNVSELDSLPYEEFKDILEYDDVAATASLLPEEKVEIKEYISENSLKRDIEKVEKLLVEEVRWFYQSGKKKRWKPFIGSDSLHIESQWRRVSISNSDINRVCVRGGMYEVDVLERKCFPVYWSSFNIRGVEESIDIIRGTWFYEANFMPLNEDMADRIEREHVERWKGCSLEEVKTLIGNTALHSVKLPNCHVDWCTVNDVYMHSDAVSHRALRNIVQRFGASKTSTSGHKLHRGYHEDSMYEDCMPPVEHLVFVVHGIGSKPDRHKIVRNTNEFRLTCERVAAKHFAHYTGRVEFLPVEWRSKLVLDSGIVETLMPRKSVGVRQFLNNSAMDIMYYTSPLYRAEIVDGLRQEIFRLYGMFMERNPDFAQHGKISVFAHSLGSVIMHDIMTGWSPEALFEEYLKKKNEQTLDQSGIKAAAQLENELAQIKIAKAKLAQLEAQTLLKIASPKGLGFVVENFFCVGSPLGIFLALRGQRPGDGQGTQDDIIPRTVCHRIFNIYHPADPIAYRFEALVLTHYISIAPLQVHSNNAIQKTPYSEMTTKPYTADTSREMTNMSTTQTSVDSDAISVDTSDNEDHLDRKEAPSNLDESDQDVQNMKCDSPDDGSMTSPTQARRRSIRSSYLKTISGGAFRVGKAILSRARGSSVSGQGKSLEIDADKSSFGKGEEEADASDNLSPIPIEWDESVGSSRSCSPAPKLNKEQELNTTAETPKKSRMDQEPQSDSISTDSIYLEHRLDYELHEGFTESRLGYASLTSHTSYWTNQDVALFVLMQIHPLSTSAIEQNVSRRTTSISPLL